MSPQNDFQNYRPITGCERSVFVFNGDFGGFQWGNGPILNIMLENDLNMIDLVKWSKWPKWPFSGMVAKGRQGSPRVSKVPGGPQGWVRWVITRSIIFKSFSYTIFKIGQFPHWNPYVKRKWLVICHFLVYKSENCFLGSLYHLASCVKGGSDSETKSLF